jgi:hypothetical protein
VERKLAQVDKQLQAQTKEIRQALVEPADEEIVVELYSQRRVGNNSCIIFVKVTFAPVPPSPLVLACL